MQGNGSIGFLPSSLMEMDYIAIKDNAATLNQKYAVIIDMIYFEGYTYVQLAKLLKLPVGTIKTRARMALTLLKKAYK